jgi:hypothetical protein
MGGVFEMSTLNKKLSWCVRALVLAGSAVSASACSGDVGEEGISKSAYEDVGSVSQALTTPDIIYVDQISTNDVDTSAYAFCPPDHPVPLGGGFINLSSANMIIAGPITNPPRGWQVSGTETTPIIAEGLCMSGGQSTLTFGTSTEVQGNGGDRCGVAQCPNGTVLAGGGWGAGDRTFVYRSMPQSGSFTKWEVCAHNDTASSALIRPYAMCVSSSEFVVTNAVSPIARVAPGTEGTADAKCLPGYRVSGNGFKTSISSLSNGVILESDAYNTQELGLDTLSRTRIRNTGPANSGSHLLQTQSLCLTRK